MASIITFLHHFTLVKFSGHIDVKFPSIVSKLDSFLLLAKIKGEVALALLVEMQNYRCCLIIQLFFICIFFQFLPVRIVFIVFLKFTPC
jgi:hypothetical protein